MSALANQLDQLRASDTRLISEALDTAGTNIESLDDAATEGARDNAVAAIDEFQAVIDNPDARDEAADDPAAALNDLQVELCS